MSDNKQEQISEALHTAIEKADALNEQARKLLTDAVRAAIAGGVDDYRQNAAWQMAKTYRRPREIFIRYQLARKRKNKKVSSPTA